MCDCFPGTSNGNKIESVYSVNVRANSHVICPLNQAAAILGFNNFGINERRSHGADDEITGGDFG